MTRIAGKIGEINLILWEDLVEETELQKAKWTWQGILDSIKPSPGYCALRRNSDGGVWWVDAGTFALSADECRQKAHVIDQKDENSRGFAAKNQALAIIQVEVKPK